MLFLYYIHVHHLVQWKNAHTLEMNCIESEIITNHSPIIFLYDPNNPSLVDSILHTSQVIQQNKDTLHSIEVSYPKSISYGEFVRIADCFVQCDLMYIRSHNKLIAWNWRDTWIPDLHLGSCIPDNYFPRLSALDEFLFPYYSIFYNIRQANATWFISVFFALSLLSTITNIRQSKILLRNRVLRPNQQLKLTE